MKFLAAFAVLLSLTDASLAANVPTVLTDIATISNNATTLKEAIQAYPDTGGSISDALAIHTQAAHLVTPINQGTTDMKALSLPISEADGKAILSAVKVLGGITLECLSAVVAKKAAFARVPIAGLPALIKQDLTNLNASTSNFMVTCIKITPTDLVPTATSVEHSVGTAFATAIAAYS